MTAYSYPICVLCHTHTISLSLTYLATPKQAKRMFKLHNQVQQNALFRTTEVLCCCWIKPTPGWGMAGFCVLYCCDCLIVLACDSLHVCTVWMWHCEHTSFFGSFYSPYMMFIHISPFFKQESCEHQNLLVTGLLGWVAVKRLFEVCLCLCVCVCSHVFWLAHIFCPG